MPNLQDNDKLLFTVWSECGEQTILNTQVLQYITGLAGPEDYVSYAAAYLDDAVALGGLIDQLIPLLSDQYVINRVSLQCIYPNRLAAQFKTAEQIGELTGTPAPINSAITITKRSIVAARYGVGSWHQTGMPVAAIATGGVDWINTFYQGFATALSNWFLPDRVPTDKSGKLEPILWSANTPLRITHVTAYEGQPSTRTMHRRTKGIGI